MSSGNGVQAQPGPAGQPNSLPGLKTLEERLSEAFLAIVRAYGSSHAIQVLSRAPTKGLRQVLLPYKS